MRCDVRYRQQVSILWPSAYKAITIFKFGHLHVLLKEDGVLDALPLSYTGFFWMSLSTTSSFCKATKWLYTGNSSRSSDLGVMSPARCPCAMPVSNYCVFGPLAMTTSFCKAGKLNDIDSEIRTHDFGPAVHLFRWVISMPAAFNVQIDGLILQIRQIGMYTGNRFRSCDLPLIRR